MKIHIVDQAEDDLVDGYNFYEVQAPGLGAYFSGSHLLGRWAACVVCWYT